MSTTKEGIKKAAAKLYSVKGFRGATMNAIAKDVGIKPPSIYSYYESKEALFFEIYKELLEEHYRKLTTILEQVQGKSTGEKLYEVLTGVAFYHMNEFDKTKMTIRIMLFPPKSLHSDISEYFLKIEEYEQSILREIFEEGIANLEIEERDPDELVTHFLCMMDGLFLGLQYFDANEFQHRLNVIWKHYWKGVQN